MAAGEVGGRRKWLLFFAGDFIYPKRDFVANCKLNKYGRNIDINCPPSLTKNSNSNPNDKNSTQQNIQNSGPYLTTSFPRPSTRSLLCIQINLQFRLSSSSIPHFKFPTYLARQFLSFLILQFIPTKNRGPSWSDGRIGKGSGDEMIVHVMNYLSVTLLQLVEGERIRFYFLGEERGRKTYLVWNYVEIWLVDGYITGNSNYEQKGLSCESKEEGNYLYTKL